MSGLDVSIFTAMLTVGISLMIAVLIKIMAILIGKFSRPDHLPIEKQTGRLAVVEEPPSDESDIAAAIAITRHLQKPFPVNY